jgi:hypothetical protein
VRLQDDNEDELGVVHEGDETPVSGEFVEKKFFE